MPLIIEAEKKKKNTKFVSVLNLLLDSDSLFWEYSFVKNIE